MVHDALFKADRVVWCGAIGYASGLRDVAGALDYGHNDARNMLERIIKVKRPFVGLTALLP